MRDKAWFFAAYNHFKIDKVVSGVPQSVATDLGIFDNYTGKGTWKPGTNNTFIGYFQQRPQAEAAARPLDAAAARIDPGAGQLVAHVQGRVAAGDDQPRRSSTSTSATSRSTGRWCRQVDPAHQRAEGVPRYDRRWPAPAGTRSRPTARSRRSRRSSPTTCPRRPAATTSSSASRASYDWYRFGINGTSGPIRYSYPLRRAPRARPHPLRRHRRGRRLRQRLAVGANTDQHYAGYAAGSLVAEQPADVHGRRAGGLPARRLRRRHAQAGDQRRGCPTATRIFPASTDRDRRRRS